MEYPSNISRGMPTGMPTGMETEVPDRTQSSSNNHQKPQTRRKSKGRRSLTPKKSKQQHQLNQKIKSKKQKLSLNSSWASRRCRNSSRTNKSTGTTYSNLSKIYKQNKQKPKMCRYWRQNKCNRDHCEFAHYELKHLNTIYNDCMKEGAKAINEVYNNNILNKMALVQVTSLQFMAFQEIESRMKQTLNYKEEREIAIINKKAFQRFKKEYQKCSKALIDDSYANKIQLKIDILKKYYEEINIKKLPNQINNTQQQNTESVINQISNNESSSIHIEIQKGKIMEIEQQKHNQQDITLINNYTLQEINQNKSSNKKKKEKEKKEENKNPLSRQNIKQDTNQNKQVERKKSISKKMESAPSKTKKQNDLTHHPIFEEIQLKHSKNQQEFDTTTIERANRLAGIISQYHIVNLKKIAIDTAENNGLLPETAQQRLFPPMMQPNNLYSQYLISQITNKQNEINEIGEHLKVSSETKQQIKAKITVDTAALYLFKASILYTAGKDKLDTMLNNVSRLATEKIKNVMRDSLQIDIQQTIHLGIRYILEYPLGSKENQNYYPEFLFNIGSLTNEVFIVAEIKDTSPKDKIQKK